MIDSQNVNISGIKRPIFTISNARQILSLIIFSPFPSRCPSSSSCPYSHFSLLVLLCFGFRYFSQSHFSLSLHLMIMCGQSSELETPKIGMLVQYIWKPGVSQDVSEDNYMAITIPGRSTLSLSTSVLRHRKQDLQTPRQSK